jgi:hypothetical protein
MDSSIISLGIDNTAGVKVVRIEQVNQSGQTYSRHRLLLRQYPCVFFPGTVMVYVFSTEAPINCLQTAPSLSHGISVRVRVYQGNFSVNIHRLCRWLRAGSRVWPRRRLFLYECPRFQQPTCIMELAHIPHHKGKKGRGLAGHLTVTLLPVGDTAAYRAKTTSDALPIAVPVSLGTQTKLPVKKKACKWTLWTLWFNTYRYLSLTCYLAVSLTALPVQPGNCSRL